MGNRNYYPSLSSGAGRVYLDFEVKGAGAADLTLSKDAAQVLTSAVRTGVGVFVLTFKDAFNACVFKSADIDDTVNDGSYATLSDVTNEGTNSPLKVTLRTRSAAGAAADPAAARRIGLSFALRNGTGWGQT